MKRKKFENLVNLYEITNSIIFAFMYLGIMIILISMFNWEYFQNGKYGKDRTVSMRIENIYLCRGHFDWNRSIFRQPITKFFAKCHIAFFTQKIRKKNSIKKIKENILHQWVILSNWYDIQHIYNVFIKEAWTKIRGCKRNNTNEKCETVWHDLRDQQIYYLF